MKLLKRKKVCGGDDGDDGEDGEDGEDENDDGEVINANNINRREFVVDNYEDDDDEEEKSKYSLSGSGDSAHSTGEGWVVVGDPAHQGGTYMNFL